MTAHRLGFAVKVLKANDLALLRLREQLGARGFATERGRLRVSPRLAG